MYNLDSNNYYVALDNDNNTKIPSSWDSVVSSYLNIDWATTLSEKQAIDVFRCPSNPRIEWNKHSYAATERRGEDTRLGLLAYSKPNKGIYTSPVKSTRVKNPSGTIFMGEKWFERNNYNWFFGENRANLTSLNYYNTLWLGNNPNELLDAFTCHFEMDVAIYFVDGHLEFMNGKKVILDPNGNDYDRDENV